MQEVGTLRGVLTLDGSEWDDALVDARSQMADFARQVGRQLEVLQRAVKQVGVALTAGVTVPAVMFGRAAVQAKSAATELQSAFEIRFRAMRNSMNQWAEATGDALGRSTQEMQRGAVAFAPLLNMAARTRGEAALLSQRLAVLAQDLSSMANTSPEEAITALAAALRGEADPIERFGILVNDNAVSQELLRQGVKRVNGEFSDQQKIMARIALIFAQSTDAQGDVIRTSGGLANQLRALGGAWEELKVKIGEILVPLIQPLVAGLRNLATWVSNLNPTILRVIVTVGALAAAMGPLAIVMATVVGPVMLARWIGTFGLMGRTMQFMIAPIAMIVEHLGLLIARMGGMAALRGAFALMTGPIGLAVTAVLLFKDEVLGALGRVWQRAQETIGPALINLFDRLREAFEGLANGPIGQAIGKIIDWFSRLSDEVGIVVGIIVERLGGALVEAIEGVINLVANMVTVVERLLAGDFEGAWRAAGLAVQEFGLDVSQVLGALDPALGEWSRQLDATVREDMARWSEWADYIGDAVTSAVDFIASLASRAWDALSGVGSTIWNALVKPFQDAAMQIGAVAAGIVATWNWVRGQLGVGAVQAGRAAGAQIAAIAAGRTAQADTPDQAIPQPRPVPQGGGRTRQPRKPRGRQGPSKEELARRAEQLRQQREDLMLSQQIAVARAAENRDEVRRLEQLQEFVRMQRAYRDAEYSAAQAEAISRRNIEELRLAEATTLADNVALAERELDLQVARELQLHNVSDQIEREKDLRERIQHLEGIGVETAKATELAMEQSLRLETARTAMIQQRVAAAQAEHQLELARLRGDRAAVREMERAASIAERARRIADEARIDPKAAQGRAVIEMAAEDEARLTGQWRSIFRDGVMSAMTGDLRDWLKDRWTDLWTNAMESALNNIADALMNMVRNAFADAGGGGEKGDWLGQAIGALGGALGLGGAAGLSAKTATGSVFATGVKVPGFAHGGALQLGGLGGVDRNLLSMNGSPIARVSRGEVMEVKPANDRGRGRGDTHFHMNGVMTNDQFWAEVDARDSRASRGATTGTLSTLGRRRARALPTMAR